MTDLLSCPFCGGKATLEEVPEKSMGGIRWTVGCNETDEDEEGSAFAVLCYGYQSLTTFATQHEAIAAWNRRASDARHAEDQAALASLQQQLDMSLELLALAREAASILMNKRIATDVARDACAKELADVKHRLVETDTLVACLRGSYLMQNHLPALALEGEDFARTFLRLTKASIERFRAA